MANGNNLQQELPVQYIKNEPWNIGNDSKVEASFTVFHNLEGITIHFFVSEATLRAQKRRINGDVYKDNCVEFFIAIENEKAYYNFEFNCFGSIKAAFGTGRENRKSLPAKLLRKIENNINVAIHNTSDSKFISWNISVTIPVPSFCFHQLNNLSGMECSANFFKCGDDLPNPHFISWSNIIADKPDFHQPSSFGKIKFE